MESQSQIQMRKKRIREGLFFTFGYGKKRVDEILLQKEDEYVLKYVKRESQLSNYFNILILFLDKQLVVSISPRRRRFIVTKNIFYLLTIPENVLSKEELKRIGKYWLEQPYLEKSEKELDAFLKKVEGATMYDWVIENGQVEKFIKQDSWILDMI